MNTLTFIHTTEGLKGFTHDDRSAALLVENPEVLPFVCIHPTGLHHRSIYGDMGDPIMIDDEFSPCPDNIEWEIVKQIGYNINMGTQKWVDSNSICVGDLPCRLVIRLSVKQEETENVLSVEEMKLEAYVDMIKDMTTIEGISLLKSLLSSPATTEPEEKPTYESGMVSSIVDLHETPVKITVDQGESQEELTDDQILSILKLGAYKKLVELLKNVSIKMRNVAEDQSLDTGLRNYCGMIYDEIQDAITRK